MTRIVYPVVAVILGMAAALVYAPSPPTKDGCETYKVRAKPVTAFVLKPPEYHQQVVTEKCETPLRPEVSEPKTEQVDSTNTNVTPSDDGHKRRKRRHRRHRRYW